ncbi:MAG: hypothetical protein SFU53_00635 [Terrimicrobiaceae bacterium]|nr:hypothetical protein [Terrimicrobiaceae bacterium]
MRLFKVALVTLLFCGAVAGLGYSLFTSGLLSTIIPPPEEVATPPPRPRVPKPTPRQLDIDALYARKATPTLLATEAAALAQYDAANPTTAAWYENGRKAVRLFVLELITGDFHGEGLLREADTYAALAYQAGCRDPLVSAVCDTLFYRTRHSLKRDNLEGHLGRADALEQSNYPALLKVPALAIAAVNLSKLAGRRENWKDDLSEFLPRRAQYLDRALAQLEKAAAEGIPEKVVVEQTQRLVGYLDRDPANMDSLSGRLEPFFTRTNLAPNARAAVLGDFLTDWAWTARGSGWAKDVTPEGWRLMNERLALGEKILEKARTDYPQDVRLPLELMRVELGQGDGKFRLNQLYEDALRIDPSSYSARSQKMYYLQPRWYGSPDEVFAFGIACAKTGDYANRLPLILEEGIWLIADQEESVFKNEKVWALLQPIFEEYLQQFPNSIRTRTRYLQWAVYSGHWDVARTQRDLLGGNWDRSELGESDYAKLISQIPSESGSQP